MSGGTVYGTRVSGLTGMSVAASGQTGRWGLLTLSDVPPGVYVALVTGQGYPVQVLSGYERIEVDAVIRGQPDYLQLTDVTGGTRYLFIDSGGTVGVTSELVGLLDLLDGYDFTNWSSEYVTASTVHSFSTSGGFGYVYTGDCGMSTGHSYHLRIQVLTTGTSVQVAQSSPGGDVALTDWLTGDTTNVLFIASGTDLYLNTDVDTPGTVQVPVMTLYEIPI